MRYLLAGCCFGRVHPKQRPPQTVAGGDGEPMAPRRRVNSPPSAPHFSSSSHTSSEQETEQQPTENPPTPVPACQESDVESSNEKVEEEFEEETQEEGEEEEEEGEEGEEEEMEEEIEEEEEEEEESEQEVEEEEEEVEEEEEEEEESQEEEVEEAEEEEEEEEDESCFQEKKDSYPLLWHMLLSVEAQHPALFFNLKQTFLKIPDEEARQLDAKIKKNKVAELKQQIRLSGIQNEVAKMLLVNIK
ncbi:hypothetical protein ACP70R_012117 [Stipagrostis hirtigluma subsp. patula]